MALAIQPKRKGARVPTAKQGRNSHDGDGPAVTRYARAPQILAGMVLLASGVFAADGEFCIGGSVVNGVTGEPIRRAAVTTPQSAALTDAGGAFHFCGLAAGAYYANAEKPGFTPAGARVTVGPSHEDLTLRLQPLSLIQGKVLDGDGNPVEGALIQLLSFAVGDGRRKVRVESAQATDDRGQYRMAHIAPGRYLLRAAGWQGPEHDSHDSKEADATFAPVYFGGATEPLSATPLTVEPGRDVDADFSVTMGAAYQIRGTLAGYSPRLPTKIELLGSGGEPTAAPALFNTATGAFQVKYAAPGSYILRATQGEGDQRLRGEQALQIVAADANDVLLTLAGATILKGTVHMAASSVPAQTSPSCSVGLAPTATAMYEEALESSTGEEGEFEIEGVLPGRYRVSMDCANGYIASVHAGGADLLAHNELQISAGSAPPPIEAMLNTEGGTVDVAATMDDDTAAAWLVLMPDSGNDIYARFALLRGKLSLAAIAPGDYQIYTWSGSPYAFEYANANVRQAWTSHAVSVKVAERDRQSISVKVTAGNSQ